MKGIFKKAEVLEGGLADGQTDFDPQSVLRGAQVELEHTDDPMAAVEIAQDHLAEDPEYYEKLEQIEE